MKHGHSQHQAMRHRLAFRAKIARLLEMPAKQYAELVLEIESDPMFLRLKYPRNNTERAIRSRRLQQSGLSNRFFELKEEIAVSPGEGGAEVEKLLVEKRKILRTIRRIGEEQFKRYFIFSEDELSLEEIAGQCRLSLEETKEVLWLVNSIDLYSEFSNPSKTMPEKSISYNKIAVIVKNGRNYQIQFTSAHWARGIYEVDHDIIERMISDGKFSLSEKNSVKKLIEKIEYINIRKSLISGIVLKIMEKQTAYINSRLKSKIAPFTQAELAADMGVHPSMISRSVYGRSLEMPWGEEKPLKAFFLSAQNRQRDGVLQYIAEILEDEKKKLQKGIIEKPFSDEDIADKLHKKYYTDISKRTVAKYRNSMNIPGAFYRK